MPERIVQVGSYYLIADYNDNTGQYTVPATGDSPMAFSKNPRSLLNVVRDDRLFASREDAETYWRDLYRSEPVWDVYESTPPGGEFVPLSVAADELGVQAATLRNQIHNRKIQGYKIGRNWVMTRDEMGRYKQERQSRPQHSR
jgi:hypothetical protein